MTPFASIAARVAPTRSHHIFPWHGTSHFQSSWRKPLRPGTTIVRVSDEEGRSGDEPPSPANPPQKKNRKAELALLMSLLVSYPAVRGTVAVLLGWYVHIQPLGTFRWDANDALYGLAFAAVPIMLMDALVMLPSWEPERTTRKMRMMVPLPVAERLVEIDSTTMILEGSKSTEEPNGARAANGEREHAGEVKESLSSVAPIQDSYSSDKTSVNSQTADMPTEGEHSIQSSSNSMDESSIGDGGARTESSESSSTQSLLVEIEREVSVRKDQHPFKSVMYRFQTERILNNPGNYLSLPSEGLLLLLVHMSEEMLYRGVLLALSAQWLTDRLYEAGIDENIRLAFVDLELAVPQLGALLAAVGMTTAAMILLVQQELFPLRLLNAAVSKSQSNKDKKEGNNDESVDSEARIRRRQRELRERYGALLPSERAEEKDDQNSARKANYKVDVNSQSETQEKPSTGQKLPEEQMQLVLHKVHDSIATQQLWGAAVRAFDELVQWSTLSTVFLFTGNIMAPIVGSIVADGVYSIWQRQKGSQWRASMLSQSREKNKQRSALLEAVREYRKHNQKVGAGKNESENVEIDSEARSKNIRHPDDDREGHAGNSSDSSD